MCITVQLLLKAAMASFLPSVAILWSKDERPYVSLMPDMISFLLTYQNDPITVGRLIDWGVLAKELPVSCFCCLKIVFYWNIWLRDYRFFQILQRMRHRKAKSRSNDDVLSQSTTVYLVDSREC